MEACKGAKSRPSALVLALADIFPFHPQTLKLRLRLLQRRREAAAMEVTYAKQKSRFLDFVSIAVLCDVDARVGEDRGQPAAVDDGDEAEDDGDVLAAGGAHREEHSVVQTARRDG